MTGEPRTFTASVAEFVGANTWLGPEHAPALAILEQVAAALDRELTAALVGQFGLAFRDLQKQAPPIAEHDELDVLLAARGEH